MFGITVEHPAHMFGDNQSILSNSSKHHSVLKKNSSRISYHFFRERVAKNEWRTTYLIMDLDPSDIHAKSLSGDEKINGFTGYFIHYVD